MVLRNPEKGVERYCSDDERTDLVVNPEKGVESLIAYLSLYSLLRIPKRELKVEETH